jgi:hypothetical protein
VADNRNPIFARWEDTASDIEIAWAKAGICFYECRKTLSWYVKDVFVWAGATMSENPMYRRDSINAEFHAYERKFWREQQVALLRATPMLNGDIERREVLRRAFGPMEDAHADALAEIEALNRLFGGVTDLHPVGPHADYRLWKTFAVPCDRKEGQELTLISAETADANKLAVRFGYRVPMSIGPDGMVCYAVQDQPAMKIKSGDRVFAPYNAA